MSKSLQLQIVTPRRVVFQGEVDSFSAPGVMGPFQILSNHAPIVAALEPGVFKLVQNGREQQLIVSGGFLEFHENSGTVLADAAEQLTEIDTERATRSLERATERLRIRDGSIDLDRAARSAARANARIKANQKIRG